MNEDEATSIEAVMGAGTASGAAQSPAGSTPPLSGANQPQAPNPGQGVASVNPVNLTPWLFAAILLMGVIILAARK